MGGMAMTIKDFFGSLTKTVTTGLLPTTGADPHGQNPDTVNGIASDKAMSTVKWGVGFAVLAVLLLWIMKRATK
jgi:hypothetical protein